MSSMAFSAKLNGWVGLARVKGERPEIAYVLQYDTRFRRYVLPRSNNKIPLGTLSEPLFWQIQARRSLHVQRRNQTVTMIKRSQQSTVSSVLINVRECVRLIKNRESHCKERECNPRMPFQVGRLQTTVLYTIVVVFQATSVGMFRIRCCL
jgi:hypothetical protein